MPSIDQSIVVTAPIAEVWKRFNNFHDLSWAKNVISKNLKVGDRDGDSVGAKRILNDVFHETLVEYLPDDYYLKYSIDDGPSPVSKEEVSNYFGVIKLSQTSDNAGTKVEWSSSWNSKSEDAVEFCHGIYVALLNDLAKLYP
ncbi:MAG: SRPBCC family protein [Candidatus Thiodiazotropha sp. (ex Lucinoma borealis)]|nr:SRPBCC family protein [Candidatus Thiodiazotropha sp. (ex Lucinoma borealis)]